jgi:hypothetical protein
MKCTSFIGWRGNFHPPGDFTEIHRNDLDHNTDNMCHLVQKIHLGHLDIGNWILASFRSAWRSLHLNGVSIWQKKASFSSIISDRGFKCWTSKIVFRMIIIMVRINARESERIQHER